MKLKVWYYNFWNHFKLLERSFTQYLSDNGYEFELNETNPDIVFINSFGQINYSGNALKIGYVTEDMHRFTGIYKKINENFFDLVIGNLPPIENIKFCKHPLYINSGNYKEPLLIINKINEFVKNRDTDDLKFCNLIASHDNYANRKPIFDKLSDIAFIECPGKFNTNVESFDDKGLSKRDYLKKFVFTICPENHFGHEGYTSEKLLDAALTGCIPIYLGRTNDNQDSKVFNQNRIIRYNPDDENSMNDCYQKVLDLMNNKDKLKEFYQQPIFNDEAEDIIKYLLNDLKIKFDNLIESNIDKINKSKNMNLIFNQYVALQHQDESIDTSKFLFNFEEPTNNNNIDTIKYV